MLRFIESLRQKPKSVRALYSFWFAALFTVAVTIIWSMSLPARMASIMEYTTSTDGYSGQSTRFMAATRYSITELFSAGGGMKGEASVTATTSDDSYEIDIAALKAASVEGGAPTDAPTEGVWQKSYTNTEGRAVLVATTSATTSSSSESDIVVQ